jgi:hypothetical protein
MFLFFLMTYEFCNFLLTFVSMNFPDFEKLLRTYPASRIKEYQRAYSLKASLLGKIAATSEDLAATRGCILEPARIWQPPGAASWNQPGYGSHHDKETSQTHYRITDIGKARSHL